MIQQDHARPPGDQPAPVMAWDAGAAQLIKGMSDHALGRALFEIDRRGGGVVWPDQAIAIVPSLQHGGGFGAQHGVDAA